MNAFAHRQFSRTLSAPIMPLISDAGWRFDNSYVRLPESLFDRTLPVPVQKPALLAFNELLAADLGIDAGVLQAAGAAAQGSGAATNTKT